LDWNKRGLEISTGHPADLFLSWQNKCIVDQFLLVSPFHMIKKASYPVCVVNLAHEIPCQYNKETIMAPDSIITSQFNHPETTQLKSHWILALLKLAQSIIVFKCNNLKEISHNIA
jgi:hypothetical protein